MSDRCTFCVNDSYATLWVTDPSEGPDPEEHEIWVCIDCLDNFEEATREKENAV